MEYGHESPRSSPREGGLGEFKMPQRNVIFSELGPPNVLVPQVDRSEVQEDLLEDLLDMRRWISL